MANCSSCRPCPSALLLLLLLVMLVVTGVCSDPQQEIEGMMDALRGHGSSLFTNAIATSDLKFQLLSSSSSSFTIFAPKDSLLYALDLVADSTTYVRTLRYHVIPDHRRTFLDLHNLSSPFLHTLLPHYSLLISNTLQDDQDNLTALSLAPALMVDGVRVSTPDLFLGSTFAVHGIDGILVTGFSRYQDLEFQRDPPPPPAAFAFDGGDISGIAAAEISPPPPSMTVPPLLDWNSNNNMFGSTISSSPAESPTGDWNNGKSRKRGHRRRRYGSRHGGQQFD